MDAKKASSIQELVRNSIFHTELRDGTVVSYIHVLLPLIGGDTHSLTISRRIVAGPGRDAQTEQAGAADVLARELGFIVESAVSYAEPVFQGPVQVGQSVILIDRSRLKEPRLDNEWPTDFPFINCT
jgi:hypothetical protein